MPTLKTILLENKSELKLIIALTLVLWSISIILRAIVYKFLATDSDLLNLIMTGIPATALIWFISHHIRHWPFILIIILGPFISIAVEFFHWELVSLTRRGHFSWNNEEFSWAYNFLLVYLWSLFYFTWYLGYFAIAYHFKFVRESLAAAEARTQANEAQLEMLRYQINPHFLFNTLNSISSLVLDKKNEKAEDMIGGLSRFLRFSLDRVPDIKTPLADEIAVIKEYLAIEEIRFSHKLSVEYDIDPDSLDCMVPSLILQPAIENAIKHGVGPLKSGGKIIVRSKVIGQRLNFCIIDSGKGLQHPPKLGVGTRNMEERLRVLYGQAGHISIKNDTELGGAIACMDIPVTRNNDGKAAHD